MENLVKLGLVKSIGISNFNESQVERLLGNCTIKPVNNQIEVSPAINQRKLVNYCNERDIIITSYCPLGRPQPEKKLPAFLHDNKLKEIADKYNKTPPQIIFRYLVCCYNVCISVCICYLLCFIRAKWKQGEI